MTDRVLVAFLILVAVHLLVILFIRWVFGKYFPLESQTMTFNVILGSLLTLGIVVLLLGLNSGTLYIPWIG